MSDIIDPLAKVGEHAASAGGGGVIALLLARLFGGQDRVITRLDALAAGQHAMTLQIAGVQSKLDARGDDVAELKTAVAELRHRVGELEVEMAQSRGFQSGIRKAPP